MPECQNKMLAVTMIKISSYHLHFHHRQKMSSYHFHFHKNVKICIKCFAGLALKLQSRAGTEPRCETDRVGSPQNSSLKQALWQPSCLRFSITYICHFLTQTKNLDLKFYTSNKHYDSPHFNHNSLNWVYFHHSNQLFFAIPTIFGIL